MTRFLIVPQWQGSPSARAMRLVAGAEAIAGDLPRSACVRVEVPTEAGEALGTGVRRLSALSRIRDATATALAAASEPALIVGGDCAVAVAGVAHAATRDPGLSVVWFDAHGDLHAPATSPTGAFAGMALRALFAPASRDQFTVGAVDAGRIVLAGARDLDDAESDLIAAAGIRTVSATDIASPAAVADAVAATGATSVYIHVDLDVLDPAAVTGVAAPVPFGPDAAALTAAIAAIRARVPLVGSSIAGFSPASPAAAVEDLGTILRVVGALA